MTAPHRPISRIFSTPRHATHYIESGPPDGPLMIFLHGWPGIRLIWHAQMDAFAADGWHCVAPDLRGYGCSSAPAADDAYTVQEVVADMAELHDHLGGTPAIWVGHDWGSPVAGALAAHESERCRGVVLVSLAYFPEAFALPTLVPLVDRTLYPADKYPDGQWDYYRYYTTQFEAAAADLDADQAATLASIYRSGSPAAIGKVSPSAMVTRNGGRYGAAPTGLNASAGISYNKFLAKLASDHRKPNGQYVISPEMGPAFVELHPFGRFHGIGPATEAKMVALGIRTGLDMRNQTLDFLEANFGKSGTYYYWISRGIDERPVRANRIRKSIGAENTFFQDLTEFDAMAAELAPLIDKVWRHCENTGSRGRTVTLKVKFADFESITRRQSVQSVVSEREELERLSIALLQNLMPLPKAVRLLGVSLSALQDEADVEPQLDLPI